MNQLDEMKLWIRKYDAFGECVIQRLVWRDFGTTLCVEIDYVWQSDGRLRREDEPRCIVTLEFTHVQELHISNRLSAVLLNDVSVLNWSFAEISGLWLDQEVPEPYRGLPMDYHRAVFRREGQDWIRVYFTELRISDEFLVTPAAC